MKHIKKFNENSQESYSEKLKRECEETEKMFTDVQKIVDEVLRIDRISNM